MQNDIATLLNDCKTIAVVGLSANPARPSYEVAAYMQARGYRIIPVNPVHAGERVLGEHCYATLTRAHSTLAEKGVPVDVVDCFRRSEHIAPVAEEAIAIGARCLWMQLGVINGQAADAAGRAGLMVVMDRCIKIEHARFFG